MADATAAGTGSSDFTLNAERTVYRATGGRRTMFSFLFLLLLPFFVCMPAMLYMRFSHGLLFDSIGLAIFAAAFAVVMFLLFIELMYSLRARVDLGDSKVTMTLPSGRGATPMLRYKTHEIAYSDVQSVETRREIYGGGIIPVMLKGARVTMKDGTQVPLGYVSEANVDPAFPYPVIAKQIADRARLPLIDRGSVRRSVRNKMLGIKGAGASGDMVSESDIAALNHSHGNAMLWFIGAFVALIVFGIVDDINSESRVAVWNKAPAAAAPAQVQPVKPAKTNAR